MEKRYQVFVSSTYTDLLEARQEVMRVLLELDCIPAGMELFPAADDDQWTLIKRVIDDCDYYIVILAGRYGSIGPEEKSFTQLEYEYAISRKKPVIAFLHKEPGKLPADHTEKDPAQAKKLEDFRKLAKKKMVRDWTTPADLGSVVSRSLVKLIKSRPAIGWVKADSLPSQEATQEIQKLRGQVAELKGALKTVSTTAPKETAPLAQGEDQFEIEYTFGAYDNDIYHQARYSASYSVSWSQIFLRTAPLMIDWASDSTLEEELNQMTGEANTETLRKDGALKYPRPKEPHEPHEPIALRFLRNKAKYSRPREDFHLQKFNPQDFRITSVAFDAIKNQLLALRLIKKTRDGWTLTPRGLTQRAELRAIRKADPDESPPRPSKRVTKARRSD